MATVRDAMGPSYPELVSDFDRISRIAVAEETAFNRTLASGSKLFDEVAGTTKSAGATVVSGSDAFTLHDTYGFPIELTLEMAAEAGLTVDEAGFRELMAEQRRRAKADAAARKHAHADLTAYRELVDAGPTEFTGFDELTSEATDSGHLRRRQAGAGGGTRRLARGRSGGTGAGPHPAVRRVRRPDRRRRHHQWNRLRRERSGSGHRRAEDRQNPVRAPGQRRVRRVRRGRHRRRGGGPRLAQGRHPRTFGHPHGARRAATSAGAQRRSGRFAEPAGLPAVRLQLAGTAIRRPSAPRSRR